jgi:hypothetical protein
MSKTSNIHRLFRQSRQVATQARIFGSQQVLDTGVFDESPEIANQTRLGVSREYIA